MTEVVLDASAVIAFFQREPGAEAVAEALPGSLLSTVNVAEVMEKLLAAGQNGTAVRLSVEALPTTITPFDFGQALLAAELRRATRSQGLSLGDRACLALAKARSVPVLTADRAWAAVDVGVEIVLIR